MKLIALGTGNAFTTGANWQSNFLLEKDVEEGGEKTTKRLLIDCGADVRHALHDVGLTLTDITDVYISHLHNDHIGGLEGLGFSTYFVPGLPRPKMYVSRFLKNEVWKALEPGMKSIQGNQVGMSDYFEVFSVPKNGAFIWEGIEFQLVQVVHIMDAYALVPSFWLLWETDYIKVFLTADTQFNPNQIRDFYNKANVILHDCETSKFPSGVHAHYNELRTLDDATKRKMYLYHYHPGDRPDASEKGFAGWLYKGQVLDFGLMSDVEMRR